MITVIRLCAPHQQLFELYIYKPWTVNLRSRVHARGMVSDSQAHYNTNILH